MNRSSAGSPGSLPRHAAAALLVLYGGIVLLQALFGAEEPGVGSTGEWMLAGLHLVVGVGAAAGLWRGRRWAWWGALLLAALGLFFLLPVAIAVVLGGGRETARSTGELAFVLSAVAVLLLLLGVLVSRRRIFRDSRGPGGAR